MSAARGGRLLRGCALAVAYPGGDVPIERGVCSDILIRAFRKQGVDSYRWE